MTAIKSHLNSIFTQLQRPENLVLIGFMGCGKSTLGMQIAKKLDFGFIDSDDFISAAQKKSIAEIFQTHGEEHFRQLEKAFVKEAKTLRHHIIATGGGMPVFCDVRQMGCVIFLDLDFEMIAKRLAQDSVRPLFDNHAQERYQARYSIYKESADFTLNANAPLEQLTQRFLHTLQSFCPRLD